MLTYFHEWDLHQCLEERRMKIESLFILTCLIDYCNNPHIVIKTIEGLIYKWVHTETFLKTYPLFRYKELALATQKDKLTDVLREFEDLNIIKRYNYQTKRYEVQDIPGVVSYSYIHINEDIISILKGATSKFHSTGGGATSENHPIIIKANANYANGYSPLLNSKSNINTKSELNSFHHLEDSRNESSSDTIISMTDTRSRQSHTSTLSKENAYLEYFNNITQNFDSASVNVKELLSSLLLNSYYSELDSAFAEKYIDDILKSYQEDIIVNACIKAKEGLDNQKARKNTGKIRSVKYFNNALEKSALFEKKNSMKISECNSLQNQIKYPSEEFKNRLLSFYSNYITLDDKYSEDKLSRELQFLKNTRNIISKFDPDSILLAIDEIIDLVDSGEKSVINLGYFKRKIEHYNKTVKADVYIDNGIMKVECQCCAHKMSSILTRCPACNFRLEFFQSDELQSHTTKDLLM